MIKKPSIMNGFQQNEMKGRSLFKSVVDQINGISNAKPTTDQFDVIDYTFQYKDQQFGAEIKARTEQAESYSTYIMELQKYNAIVKLIREGKIARAYYVCFFGENTVYMFDVHTIYKSIGTGKAYQGYMYMPKTTSGDQTMVQKQVIHLKPEIADKLVRIEGKWQKV